MSRPNYESASPQLELDGAAPVANAGIGDEHDFYPTPRWVTHAILPHLPRAGSYLDPFAGTGEILAAVREARGDARLNAIEIEEGRAATLARGVLVGGATIMPTVYRADALRAEWPRCDVIATNPPFEIAERCVRAVLEHGADWGATTATLLRLAFLESAGREDFWRTWGPRVDVYVMINRPSFIDRDAVRLCSRCKGTKLHPRLTPGGVVERVKCTACRKDGTQKGGTDNSAYMWLVSGPGRGGRFFHLYDRDPSVKLKKAKT